MLEDSCISLMLRADPDGPVGERLPHLFWQ